MARTINSLAGIIKRLPDTTPRTGCIKHILFPFPAPRGRGHLPSNAIRDNAMNVRISALVAIAAFALAGLLGSGQSLAQNAYITNLGSNTVSVIDTKTNKVTATIPVGAGPLGVAVSPDGSKVYITNDNDNPGTVAVIGTATNKVIATIPVGDAPFGVAVSPDGGKVYVVNEASNPGTVSVIGTATNKVIATIPVGPSPFGMAVTPDGSKVFVANEQSQPGSVSVIDAATNAVTATIPVGSGPQAFGIFIQPVPRFAGTPGKANCYGKSVSALARQYGGLNSAAAALGYSDVSALQTAIMAFCEG